jgi:serine protease AprX
VGAAAAAALVSSFTGVIGGSAANASANETVIVTASGLLSPVAAVTSVLGSVLQQFSVINGVEASVPALALPILSALPGISVTPDLAVSVESTNVSTGPHPGTDAFLQQTGATTLAHQGDIGQGVTVAVLDTGIDNLPDFAGRLVGGVDLTGGGNPFTDQYGHGTFVAGLLAGNGASSNGQYSGEAPGANLVAIKAAGATGNTDLATVIQGVQWAILHKSTYDISVLNMSLGFQPIGSTVLNPVDMAVEAAWNAGITVVASAGNAGPFNGTILSPGDDPLVITVGALDDLGQTNVASDAMSDFSSAGPTNPDGWVKPDIVAPGRSVVSLAAPGSTVYNTYPSARIGSANFVGSGTSFSAPITSGAAALVLQQHPDYSPNQLKAVLLGTTAPGPIGNPFVDGHGALDAAAAVASAPMNLNQSTLGVIIAAIGQMVSLEPTGPADTWNPNLWSGVSWNGSRWAGSRWAGSNWNGSDWNSFTWNASAWAGSAWAGSRWAGSRWAGSAWTGSRWAGSAWAGSAWAGSRWAGSRWA